MNELKHWDFATAFSGFEAASLMLGIDPRRLENKESHVSVPLNEIKKCYKNGISHMNFHLNGGFHDDHLDIEKIWPIELISEEMEFLERRSHLYEDESSSVIWINDQEKCDFKNQRFSRSTIVHWLKNMGVPSAYKFNLTMEEKDTNTNTNTNTEAEAEAEAKTVISESAGKWPWGNHQTAVLEHLEAAANEFWVKYQVSKDIKDAPKNDTVVEWLVATYKQSNSMANSIATMLRPQEIRTGPKPRAKK